MTEIPEAKEVQSLDSRFDEVYWNALYDENQRVKELKFLMQEERKNIVRDVLKRINRMPMPDIPSQKQEELILHIAKWMDKVCIPGILKDYKF